MEIPFSTVKYGFDSSIVKFVRFLPVTAVSPNSFKFAPSGKLSIPSRIDIA